MRYVNEVQLMVVNVTMNSFFAAIPIIKISGDSTGTSHEIIAFPKYIN